MDDAGEYAGRVVGVRQHVEDGLDRASRLVLTQALPRLTTAGVGFRSVELDAMGVSGVDVLREAVQLLGDPGRLRLKHGNAAEDKVLFAHVADGTGIVKVEQVHRSKAGRMGRYKENAAG